MGVATSLQLVKYFAQNRQPRAAVFNINNGEEDWLNGAHACVNLLPLSWQLLHFHVDFWNIHGLNLWMFSSISKVLRLEGEHSTVPHVTHYSAITADQSSSVQHPRPLYAPFATPSWSHIHMLTSSLLMPSHGDLSRPEQTFPCTPVPVPVREWLV